MSEQTSTRPLWLDGPLAPVPDEIDAADLQVTGVLPAELTGRYFRNGPNPTPGEETGHWFSGQGMVHGVRLRDGRAEWYRNRWVKTTAFTEGAEFVRPDLTFDRAAVSANTHVIPHNDRIYALVEVGFPYELTPDLETVGPCDFGGTLTTGMTAHPKRDPRTGELLFFGYGFLPPYLTYHRLSADGELVESREVQVPGPTMMHDFAITENHVVWLDLPMLFDIDLAFQGRMPYSWQDDYGYRLGVMPRDPSAGSEVTWFDVDPCFVFHVGNAHEDAAGRVVLDGARYTPGNFLKLWSRIGKQPVPDRISSAALTASAQLHRWTLDPATGKASEETLDDRRMEFPTHDDSRTGLEHRYLYVASGDTVVKHDLRTGATAEHTPEHGGTVGEAIFVAASGARNEDEGWLLSIVTDEANSGSQLLVLDASDLSHTASVRLPRRVPLGFHGSWIPDAPLA